MMGRLTLDEAHESLVRTLTLAKLGETTRTQTGPSALELDIDIEPELPRWWQWRKRARRQQRREQLAAHEYANGLISFSTYRRVTPWLWEVPDAGSVW
jgi:hypothetical protein